MYFTDGSSRAFEMLMRGSPALTATKTAAVPTVWIAIPVTFTARTGSINSACMRSVRMSRES